MLKATKNIYSSSLNIRGLFLNLFPLKFEEVFIDILKNSRISTKWNVFFCSYKLRMELFVAKVPSLRKRERKKRELFGCLTLNSWRNVRRGRALGAEKKSREKQRESRNRFMQFVENSEAGQRGQQCKVYIYGCTDRLWEKLKRLQQSGGIKHDNEKPQPLIRIHASGEILPAATTKSIDKHLLMATVQWIHTENKYVGTITCCWANNMLNHNLGAKVTKYSQTKTSVPLFFYWLCSYLRQVC